MLTTEERQAIRRLSESVSGILDDERKEACGQAAHRLIDTLRETCGSDDVASRVAVILAEFCASLERLPLMFVVDTIDASGAAYSFAAGSLAGVYTLPERTEPAADVEPAASDADDQAWPGQYL